MLPLQGTWIPSLVRDLNSHMPKKERKRKEKQTSIFRAVSGSPQNGSGRCRGSPRTRCSSHAQPSARAASPPEGMSAMTDHPESRASRGFTPGYISHAVWTNHDTHPPLSTMQQRFTVLPPPTTTQALTTTVSLLSPRLCHFHDVTR